MRDGDQGRVTADESSSGDRVERPAESADQRERISASGWESKHALDRGAPAHHEDRSGERHDRADPLRAESLAEEAPGEQRRDDRAERDEPRRGGRGALAQSVRLQQLREEDPEDAEPDHLRRVSQPQRAPLPPRDRDAGDHQRP